MRSFVLAATALLCTATAQAGYYTWETVTLPAASGAACGDGSPYRIFVNRALFTKKTVVMFEGGGACWSQGVCEGDGGILGKEVGNVEAAQAFGIPPCQNEVRGAAGLAGVAPREVEEALEGGACCVVH